MPIYINLHWILYEIPKKYAERIDFLPFLEKKENVDLVIVADLKSKTHLKKTIFIVLSFQATFSFAAGKTIHFKGICAIYQKGHQKTQNYVRAESKSDEKFKTAQPEKL